MVYGQKHAKINFHNSHYAKLYKNILYFVTKLLHKNVEFNAIAEDPSPRPYFLCIYFSNVHQLIYEIN